MAKLVSDVLGPVPAGLILAVAVGIHSGRGVLAGAAWGLLSITCAAVLPAVTTAPLRRRRPRTRAVRLNYMSLAVAGAAIGLAAFWLLPAPSDIRILTAGFAAGLVCSAAVNVLYASSNHVAALAGGTILATGLLSPIAAVATVLVIIQGWARVHVGYHTANEAWAGAGVGIAATVITLLAACA